MDAAEPRPADLLRAGAPKREAEAATVTTDSSGRPDHRSGPSEGSPSVALGAKLAQLTALRDRGLLSPEELTVATARLLGL